MCRLYVSFVLVTEVHCGAETFMGQGEMELSVLQCERLPALPQQPPLILGEDFPKIRVVSQPLALKPSWRLWLRGSPAPQRQQESCTPLPSSQGQDPGQPKVMGFCQPALQN